ncbi:MAG: T9SS type A sorting domain-containing protein [Flavobacteriales bacterium]|nr:T9SS type A sorting domain-containing protein [Flavobacteriales bacterium]
MRRILTFLLAALTGSSIAQNWAPFPLDETSEWSIGEAIFDGQCFHSYRYNYQVNGTGLLNGHEYALLSGNGTHMSQNTNWNYPECVIPLTPITCEGLMRAENGKYYVPDGTNEVLVFDFTKGTGDTIVNNGSEFVIDSVDQIDVNGKTCIRQWVSDEFQQPIWIVEGVGHQFGLFQPIYQFENGSTLCYRENGVPLLYYPYGNSCHFLDATGGNDNSTIEVSPNPSSGIFNLTVQQQFSYQVYDLFGRLIQAGAGSANAEIDLRSEPDGVYLLRIESKKGSRIQKLAKQ